MRLTTLRKVNIEDASEGDVILLESGSTAKVLWKFPSTVIYETETGAVEVAEVGTKIARTTTREQRHVEARFKSATEERRQSGLSRIPSGIGDGADREQYSAS